MTFTLKPLPYEPDALSPIISQETISFHYEKHHATYLKNLNELIKGTDMEKMTLENIIVETRKHPSEQAVFNNAAQVWNHDFYWQSMRPFFEIKSQITDNTLLDLIARDFGDVQNLKEALKKTALGQFGSGWCWLVLDKDTLKVIRTANAENPLGTSKPLLCIDVWEHAYYLDFQNKRADYLNGVIEHLLNWDFAVKNLSV